MSVTASCAVKPIPVVYQCPNIQLPKEPKEYTSKLTQKSRPDEVVKAYYADLSSYKAWCEIVKKQLD